ncbi:hypothetical protein [Staphylococcus saprophyticus]|uniref:hypothetical protein n=1 Tax=Staphylococcus saprophyticus TaxID=29385 RepID=UPI0015FAA2D8|nr:hypothetical protein [Staphylococcus saprophyticus]
MIQKGLEQYLLQSLNMALGSMMQGETSYTNSFTCHMIQIVNNIIWDIWIL